jgi:hypothetical protein
MWFYKHIPTGRGSVGIALAALVLAWQTPRAQSGFKGVPLAFDVGSNPGSVATAPPGYLSTSLSGAELAAGRDGRVGGIPESARGLKLGLFYNVNGGLRFPQLA